MPEQTNPKELRAAADAKAPLDYLEPLVNAPVARVMKHGGDKYGYRNYVHTPMKIRTYIGSTRRHLDALAMGEDIDPDSGESHWAHIIGGASAYFASELSGNAVDDRAPTSTPRSDAVHIDGDLQAKAGVLESVERDKDPYPDWMCPTHRHSLRYALGIGADGGPLVCAHPVRTSPGFCQARPIKRDK